MVYHTVWLLYIFRTPRLVLGKRLSSPFTCSPLDHHLATRIQAALPVIHANYTPNPAAPLTGTLSLPPADADQSPVVFDLGKDVRAKLFAVEIAHVLQAANQVQEGTLQGDRYEKQR